MNAHSVPFVTDRARVLELYLAFLRMGVSCFGGPAAHIGYFRSEFVFRRHWLSEHDFADLVGLCQFLPGPASSQTGFAIGVRRAGVVGGLAAWLGFTLPSAVLMVAFASLAPDLTKTVAGAGIVHGLKLAAVAIVAQAVWGMARNLCPDRPRATIAALCAGAVLLAAEPAAQLLVIAAGGLAGLVFCRHMEAPPHAAPSPIANRSGYGPAILCLVIFVGLLLAACVLPHHHPATAIFAAFYRSGALVFGGGHVVLPLLRDAVVTPGWVSPNTFLAGYGAAQALPGPLFSIAAYLGASLHGPVHGLAGAALALVAIALPGLLLVLGILPFWDRLSGKALFRAALRGVNAAVVGLLGAALYDPVWIGAVFSPADCAFALLAVTCLTVWNAPPLLIVGASTLCGLAQATL